MKKFKKAALTAASYVSVAALAIGGTVAYLQSESSNHNKIKTAGNVEIEQLEYQRIKDDTSETGWVAADDEYAATFGEDTYYPDKLVEFKQGQNKILPVVGKPAWDDRNGTQEASGAKSHQQSWKEIGAPGSNQLFDKDFANVVDKFVFVKNTGTEDCYYRTIIAVEDPVEADGMVSTNRTSNTRFDWDPDTAGVQAKEESELIIKDVYINGVRYYLMVATYQEVLTPNEISRPSLLQAYLSSDAGNEELAAFGENLDILVYSQAVQAEGFDNAQDALEESFGKISATTHPWSDINNVKSFSDGTHYVNNAVAVSGDNTDAVTASGEAVIHITGGTYDAGIGNAHTAVWAYDNATVYIEDGYFYASGENAEGGYNDVIYAKDNAKIYISGGFFEGDARESDGQCFILNLKDDSAAQIIVTGGTFVNFNPAKTGTEPAGVNDNFVADGYKVVEEIQDNGDIWYTVVAE